MATPRANRPIERLPTECTHAKLDAVRRGMLQLYTCKILQLRSRDEAC